MRAFFALCLCLSLLLVSCGTNDYTPTDIIYKVIEKSDNLPSYNVYFNSADKESDEYLDTDKQLLLYNGMSPCELSTSFAVMLSKDDSVYEIHVYKSDSEINVPRIKKILGRRIELLQDNDVYLYEDENYEQIVSSARIISKGRYVFLLVTDRNNEIEELVKDML